MLSRALLIANLIAFVRSQHQCFAPDGSGTSDLPCSTGGQISFCCPPNSVCLSIGVCQVGNGFIRGSCTDPTFSSNSCLQQCISENQHGSTFVAVCTPESFGEFCCSGDSENNKCCSNPKNLFHLGNPSNAASLPFSTPTPTSTPISISTIRPSSTLTSSSIPLSTAASTTPSSTSAAPSIAPPSSSSISSTASTDSSSTNSSTSSTDSGTTITSKATSAATVSSTTSTSSTATATAAAAGGLSTGAKAGIAVGAVGGFAALAFAASMVLFLRRRNNQMQENERRVDELRQRNAKSGGSGGADDASTIGDGNIGVPVEALAAAMPPMHYADDYGGFPGAFRDKEQPRSVVFPVAPDDFPSAQEYAESQRETESRPPHSPARSDIPLMPYPSRLHTQSPLSTSSLPRKPLPASARMAPSSPVSPVSTMRSRVSSNASNPASPFSVDRNSQVSQRTVSQRMPFSRQQTHGYQQATQVKYKPYKSPAPSIAPSSIHESDPDRKKTAAEELAEARARTHAALDSRSVAE